MMKLLASVLTSVLAFVLASVLVLAAFQATAQINVPPAAPGASTEFPDFAEVAQSKQSLVFTLRNFVNSKAHKEMWLCHFPCSPWGTGAARRRPWGALQ